MFLSDVQVMSACRQKHIDKGSKNNHPKHGRYVLKKDRFFKGWAIKKNN